MRDILNTIFSTNMYSSQTDRIKALFVYGVIGIVFLVTIISNVVNLIAGTHTGIIYPIITVLMLGIVYALIRNKYQVVASWILLTSSFVTITSLYLFASYDALLVLLFNITILLLAGFLLGTRGNIIFALLNIVQLMILPDLVGQIEDGASIVAQVAFIYLTTSAILYIYNHFVIASRLEGQHIEAEERLKLAEVNMRITRQASTRESLDSALNTTLALILENYPQIYHAQVFLVGNDGIQAKLAASTGEIGRTLLANKHSLAVGSLSVIGQTTLSGETVIAKSDDRESVHRNNELLADTQLEAAFPLIVGTEIIGALDLQSKVLEDLSENDLLSFQSLANSLALAIDSIRQFDQAKTRIEENQRLTEQTRTALREVERLNQRLIGRAWAGYVHGLGDELGFVSDFDTETTESYLVWSDTLVSAVDTDSLVQAGNILAVPLRVRGQVIGAVEFELEEYKNFSPEDLDLIVEVTERFGLAAENTRLVEESQQSAQREALINQITSRFQSAQNVEATLAEAARSLNESLNTSKVMIRLGVPEASHNGKDS